MIWQYSLAGVAALVVVRAAWIRVRLSRAKHPSLRGHAKMAKRLVKLIPFYEYGEEEFFTSDDAPTDVASKRRAGFQRLAEQLRTQRRRTIDASAGLADGVSDVAFTNAYRVPFQYRNHVAAHLELGCLAEESSGRRIRDLDGNWLYDLTGSYGVNVFGYDFYKTCIDRGAERARALGPVLGPYHPVIRDNVQRLKAISGLDEVSFHMSGTEAVMQAVRLARYHTGRPKLVRLCGAYHGWWDGVQPGVGSPRNVRDVYTLRDVSERTLAVLRTRKDIACVLINGLQALNPNANAPSDAFLISGGRSANFDKQAYSDWLRKVREICTERGIVLIIDDVFLGFRIALRGSQEYFGIDADLVTYGKTLGGGLPVGVVCGKRELMKRYRDDRPSDICFARGTFNSHPYVLTTMNEFLLHVDQPDVQKSYASVEDVWNQRAQRLNARLEAEGFPVRVANMVSVWTTLYTRPGRYHWMFQYYLRAEGLALSWIGTGRFIFSHDYTDADFDEVLERVVRAAQRMQDGGWWWHDASLTAGSIQKRVLREVLRTRFGRRRS